MDKYKIDYLVIGAGVSGMAIARNLAKSNKETILIDQNSQIGQEASSRNSEVIHAGIYYPKGSLKSQLCVTGKQLLYEYLESHGIDYLNCGKFIVSTSDEESQRLKEIKDNAQDCGIEDLTFDNIEIKNYPFINFEDSLFSPSSGIFDSHSFMTSLKNEFEDYDGLVILRNRYLRIERNTKNFHVFIQDKNTNEKYIIETKKVINCAGLGAANIANCLYEKEKFKLKLVKGEYYTYSGREKLNHLIYPLPSEHSLGTHATIDLGKGIRFGPSAYMVDSEDYSINSNHKDEFYESIKSYWPSIGKEQISPAYTGIRATIDNHNDFIVDTRAFDDNILVSILGYVSPGLTSSLALADYVESSIISL